MDVSKWITSFRKSVRSKKSPLTPQRVEQIAGVSLIVLVSVGALAFAAHRAAPSIDAAPGAVVTKAPPPAPARTTNVVKARSVNAAAAAQTPDVVTITGCLEQDHDTFKLKDTGGADAPKSRNWKTGFIKKHSSSVTLVDGANRLKLGTHVGERVSVTGTMVDRAMQGRSLRSVTASCE